MTVLAHRPAERPQVVVSSDGTLAAVCERPRVTVLDLATGGPLAELAVDPTATGFDVAWLGTPPRLLLISRYEAHSAAHLLEVEGARSLAEIHVRSVVRLAAAVGLHALVLGEQGAAVLTASDTQLTPHSFPSRTVPAVAGAAAAQFVVALPGIIEEWDPQSRMPKRRLRLPPASSIKALGGSERIVWMISDQDPSRIDVLPLINRGQPKRHDLPEPIASISGHPRSDIVACAGAETGRLYAIDLDGRAPVRVLSPPGLDQIEAATLVVGRVIGVLAAQRDRPVVFVPLDEPARISMAMADPRGVDQPVRVMGGAGSARAVAPPPEPIEASPRAEPGSGERSTNLAERFAALRERRLQAQGGHAAVSATVERRVAPARSTWRDECVAWARAAISGTVDHGPPGVPALDALAKRHGLAADLVPALVLLYGAHLGGERGVAAVDVARVLGGRWDEALARGQLAARGLVELASSRLCLVPAVEHALDTER